jgi:subtilase family serine protease
MRVSLRWLLPAGAIVTALALAFAWMTASGATSAKLSASTTAQPAFQAACPPASADGVTCFAVYRAAAKHAAAENAALPAGYSPGALRAAYDLAGLTAGAGRTVAVVDAFNDPNAASDMAHYRKQFGLPACTVASHCFRKVNENGGTRLPAANVGWAAEISLDLDMVSAICSKCHILLVEASTTRVRDLGTAVNTAVRLGARYVSNSYGAPEFAGEAHTYNHFFNHPGVAVTFSAGDSGFGVNYPAASPFVTAVGGTSLHRNVHTARGWTESAWSGTGSGCSKYSARPGWQPKLIGCPTHRTVADVSAVADPATGVLVYDTYHFAGWDVFGGTSASAPIIAAAYARAGVPRAHTYPASYPYHHKFWIFDVNDNTSNGSCSVWYLCHAVRGYDGPTGLGTPRTAGAFRF